MKSNFDHVRLCIILLFLVFLFSCDNEDEIGVCNAYDENGKFVLCLSDRTEGECAKLDADQHRGYNWEFIQGADICGPPLSEP